MSKKQNNDEIAALGLLGVLILTNVMSGQTPDNDGGAGGDDDTGDGLPQVGTWQLLAGPSNFIVSLGEGNATWTLLAVMADVKFNTDAASTSTWTLLATSTMTIGESLTGTPTWTLLANAPSFIVKKTVNLTAFRFLRIEETEGGFVQLTPSPSFSDGINYYFPTNSKVIAQAIVYNDAWYFTGWQNWGTGYGQTLNLTMSVDRNVTPLFTRRIGPVQGTGPGTVTDPLPPVGTPVSNPQDLYYVHFIDGSVGGPYTLEFIQNIPPEQIAYTVKA